MTLGNFRKDYIGEYILTKTTIRDGKKIQEREWVDNPIKNQHISNRASVLGSSIDKDYLNFEFLRRHRGGLLASKKLQIYGTYDLLEHSYMNFMVCLDKDNLPNLIERNYDEETIVYTSVKNCLRYPGHFCIVPHTPQLDERAMILYCAAFDGHNEIFMHGYHYNDSNRDDQSLQVKQIGAIFNAYPSIEFNFVGHRGAVPKYWEGCDNFSYMSYPEWVSHCDIGFV